MKRSHCSPGVTKGNTSAMLALAYISPEAEAVELMHKAAERGDANAMMLYGVTPARN